ncbi:MAG TPA: MFS transporter [Myxococcales bacterium]|nr:MFS transporter [Myxococcales bacterium]
MNASDSTRGASAAATFSPVYTRYVLGLLALVYIVNFVDRQVLSILLESIKLDLGLSDTQLGLLSGTAFGLFYATLGIPIARLADIYSRKWVIVIALTIWSLMTALCGAASSFAVLLLCRVGVGVGEAGGSPPSHAVISDLFPPEKRGAALGIFSLGVPLGILVGLMAGGWLDETLGWRMAFMVVGLPGLILSVIVALTLREPIRGMADGFTAPTKSRTAREVIAFLWRSPSFRHTALGSALYAFVGYSFVTWAPSFLKRSHGMESGEVGTWLALIIGIGGGIGVYGGGWLSDRWALRDPRGRSLLPALAMIASLPFWLVAYLTPSTGLALAMMVPPATFGLMYQAPALAITQGLSTPAMRATAGAVLLFVINIVGLGVGPAVTGWLSDLLEPRFGSDSLGYALLIVSMVLAGAGYEFWRASHTLAADLEFVRSVQDRETDERA